MSFQAFPALLRQTAENWTLPCPRECQHCISEPSLYTSQLLCSAWIAFNFEWPIRYVHLPWIQKPLIRRSAKRMLMFDTRPYSAIMLAGHLLLAQVRIQGLVDILFMALLIDRIRVQMLRDCTAHKARSVGELVVTSCTSLCSSCLTCHISTNASEGGACMTLSELCAIRCRKV